jgi:hypothetical protein
MSSGALGKLTQLWALDTTFVAPVKASKPAREIDVFFQPGSRTDPGGKTFEGAVQTAG